VEDVRSQSVIEVGELKVDLNRHLVFVGGREVHLTPHGARRWISAQGHAARAGWGWLVRSGHAGRISFAPQPQCETMSRHLETKRKYKGKLLHLYKFFRR